METAKVAVCDDIIADIESLAKYLQEYAEKRRMELILSTFTDGQEFLQRYRPVYDVIFLDIRMFCISGDIIAEKIRQWDKEVPIIFISSYMDAVFRGYELHIQNYLRKPVSYETLSKEMDRALSSLFYLKSAYFWEEGAAETIKVYHNKLEYIETGIRCTILHYDNRMIESHRKLKTYEALLNESDFYRCNNSYIVNLRFIERIVSCGKRYDIELLTGARIPLSRGNKEECMERLISVYQKM